MSNSITSKREAPAEPLKRAIGVTTRAVAADREMLVGFAAGTPGLAGNSVQLPEPSRVPSRREIAVIRGWADSLALTAACHNVRLHSRLAPASGIAREVFEAVEKARVEAIGANRMAGMADNLSAKLDDHFAHGRFAHVTDRESAPLSEAMALMVRERLTGRDAPETAQAIVDVWRPWIEKRCGKLLERMEALTEDQERFGRLLHEVLTALELTQDWGREQNEKEEAQGEQEPDGGEQDSEDSSEGDEGQETAGDSEATESEESNIADMTDSADTQDFDVESDAPEEAETAEPWRPNPSVLDDPERFGYRIYSRDFDEEVQADDLSSPEELDRLRAFLDKEMKLLASTVARLANRLQRRLLAQQNRAWDFDLEEGALDAARLTRIIIDPMHPLSFKQERDMEFRDTVVTLLLDNSGSMRGRPIMVAACAAEILARTLERCGVKVEILGFTTRAWKGGQARERWMEAGKPGSPGRLNDVRHIVYKTADTPWRRAKRSLALMMREGMLKENIDGEALAWAHARLMARHEQRRILMMISDGAPVDDSTLSVNSGSYLEQHLRQVIAEIEGRSPVELLAIGIGHDVTRYYKRAVTISDPSELAGAMTDKLVELFEEQGPARGDGAGRPAGRGTGHEPGRRPQPRGGYGGGTRRVGVSKVTR
jgi:cobaltochelatase CobT